MPDEADGLVAQITMSQGWLDAARLRRVVAERLAAGRAIHPLLDILLEDKLLTEAQCRVVLDELGRHRAAAGDAAGAAVEAAVAATPATGVSLPEEPFGDLPSRPATGWGRLLTTALWVAGCAAVLALLVSLAAPPRPDSQKHASTRRTARPAPPAKKKADGALSRPEPPPPQPTAPPDPAAELAKAALAYDRQNPTAHGQALLRLRRALLATHTASLSTKLSARLTTRRHQADAAAQQAIAALDKGLGPLRKGDRFGDALRACAAYPPELRSGQWAAAVDARRADLGAAAEQRYTQLLTHAAHALVSRDSSAARRAYEQLGAFGIPWIAATANHVAAAAQAYAASEAPRYAQHAATLKRHARRQAFAPLSQHAKHAEDMLKQRHYDKALEAIQAIPETLRSAEAKPVIKALEARLGRLAGLWDAIVAGPKAAIGREFRLHGIKGEISGFSKTPPQVIVRIQAGGTPRSLPQRIDRLPPAQFVQLAEWALAGRPAAEATLLTAALLQAEGQDAQAEAKLAQAKALGADTTEDERDHTAKALATQAITARHAGQWEEAAKLLASALDDYGDTLSVIARHPELTEALGTSLRRLDRPAVPEPFEPARLPTELRALLLLPETRLGPTGPADPLAAHMATPLVRGSPVVVGAEGWTDYQVALDFTPVLGASVQLLARLSEPQPGRFACYALTLDGSRITLDSQVDGARKTLRTVSVSALMVPRRHRVLLSLVGGDLNVQVDGKPVLRASHDGLTHGRIALVSPDAEVRVHRLVVLHAAPDVAPATRRRPIPKPLRPSDQ
ncbi:MAG: hypothetical protein ISS72_02415 [Candidatus Brocadiae bacterium]|nr:hypothetical protein [Candidatus Brocadiia bacterium]